MRWLSSIVRSVRDVIFLPPDNRGHLGSWLYAGLVRLVASGQAIATNTGALGNALTTAVLTRTSGVTTYPLLIDFTRPVDWQDGDTAQMQRSQDVTFLTGEIEPIQTMAGATTTYDFGLTNVLSGIWYFRMSAWHGGRPAVLTFSNIVGVGDNTTPTITSASTFSGYQFVAGTFALTASKSGYWAIVGGAYQDQFSISGSTLAWDAQSLAASIDVQVQFTDYFGNTSAIQTITGTIAANTPSAFTFTDVTNATLSQTYTSNTITLGGAAPGPYPISVTTGTYSKNGGAYTSAAGTAVSGDTITLQDAAPSSNNSTLNAVFTAGVTSDTWSISSPVVLTTTTTWNPSDKNANIALSNTGGTNMTAAGTVTASNGMVRTTTGKSTGKRYAELAVAMTGGLGRVGISDGTESLNNYPGATIHSVGYQSDGAMVNCVASTGTAYNNNNNHIVGIATDCDAGTMDIYLDNVLQSHAPYSGNGPLTAPLYIAFSAGWTSTAATLNTGHSAWVYGPPSGYSAWDV